VKEGRRRSGAARGRTVRREDRSRPWEEPDPPSPGMPTSPTSSSSPTTRHRLPLLHPRRQAAPPHCQVGMQLLAGAAAFVNARRFHNLAFLCRRVRRPMPVEPATPRRAGRVRVRACARTHANPTPALPCTPARARIDPGEARLSLGPSPSRTMPPPCLSEPRRRGLAVAGNLVYHSG
jgi:hypothetical protein